MPKRWAFSVLKPWDIDIKNYVDPVGSADARPFKSPEEQIDKTNSIFNNIDPRLGEFFRVMVAEDMIDLPNRKHKGPGAYCTGYNLIRKPFVFCNSVGTQNDVSTLWFMKVVMPSMYLKAQNSLICPSSMSPWNLLKWLQWVWNFSLHLSIMKSLADFIMTRILHGRRSNTTSHH